VTFRDLGVLRVIASGEARTATPEQAPGRVFIKKRQVTHSYSVSPHGSPTSREIPINDPGRVGRDVGWQAG
jgi:hypothetical protein